MTRRVLAIEILCAAQGIEYRVPLEPGHGVADALELIRRHVPPLTEDRSPSEEIEVVAGLIEDGTLTGTPG